MNDDYKNTRGELIAIYRLEFYKKQSNWKLCHDEKKKKNTSEPSVKLILNETYNVDSTEPEVEPFAPLNDAFMADESDKDIPDIPSPTEEPKAPSPTPWLTRSVSLQELKAHEHSIWGEADNNWITPVEACQQRGYIEPIKQYSREWWPTPGPQSVSSDPQPDKWTPAEYEPDYYCQGVEECQPWPGHELCRPDVPCTCWTNWQQLAREYALTGESMCVEETGVPTEAGEVGEGGGDVGGGAGESLGSAHTVLRTADAWLRTKDASHVDWESCSLDISADSAWSFMVGARAQPHSSELDLAPYTACSCVCEPRHLSSLSVSELFASLSQHADVLRKLLKELHARHRHRQHNPYKPANISHERPTRDTGPSPPPRPLSSPPPQSPPRLPFPLVDPFVAGSFLHTEIPGGRGRGRRLIGIGMGRPYRL